MTREVKLDVNKFEESEFFSNLLRLRCIMFVI